MQNDFLDEIVNELKDNKCDVVKFMEMIKISIEKSNPNSLRKCIDSETRDILLELFRQKLIELEISSCFRFCECFSFFLEHIYMPINMSSEINIFSRLKNRVKEELALVNGSKKSEANFKLLYEKKVSKTHEKYQTLSSFKEGSRYLNLSKRQYGEGLTDKELGFEMSRMFFPTLRKEKDLSSEVLIFNKLKSMGVLKQLPRITLFLLKENVLKVGCVRILQAAIEVIVKLPNIFYLRKALRLWYNMLQESRLQTLRRDCGIWNIYAIFLRCLNTRKREVIQRWGEKIKALWISTRRVAVIKMQTISRCFRARRTVAIHRKAHSASIAIQTMLRSTKMQRRFEFIKIKAIKIESVIRMYLTSNVYKKYLRSTILIQRNIRKYLCVRSYDSIKWLVKILQRLWRKYFVVLTVYRVLDAVVTQIEGWHMSASKLTKVARSFLAKKRVRERKRQLLLLEGAALKVQLKWYLSINQFPAFVLIRCLSLDSAITKYKKYLEWKAHRYQNAMIIQCSWRKQVACRETSERRRKNVSASGIQRSVRIMIGKRRLFHFRAFMQNVRNIQRFFRRRRSLMFENLSIRVIQRFAIWYNRNVMKLYLERKYFEHKYLELTIRNLKEWKAACVVQTIARRVLAKNLCRRRFALRLLCKHWKSYRGRCLKLSNYLLFRKNVALSVASNKFNGVIGTIVFSCVIALNHSNGILSHSVGIVMRKRIDICTSEYHCLSLQAAIRLQDTYRKSIARKRLSNSMITLALLKNVLKDDLLLIARTKSLITCFNMLDLRFPLHWKSSVCKSEGNYELYVSIFNSPVKRLNRNDHDNIHLIKNRMVRSSSVASELFLRFYPDQLVRATNFGVAATEKMLSYSEVLSILRESADGKNARDILAASTSKFKKELTNIEKTEAKFRTLLSNIWWFVLIRIKELCMEKNSVLFNLASRFNFDSGRDTAWYLKCRYFFSFLRKIVSCIVCLQCHVRGRIARLVAFKKRVSNGYIEFRSLERRWMDVTKHRRNREVRRLLRIVPRFNNFEDKYSELEYWSAAVIQSCYRKYCAIETFSMLLKQKRKQYLLATQQMIWEDNLEKSRNLFEIKLKTIVLNKKPGLGLEYSFLKSPINTEVSLEGIKIQKFFTYSDIQFGWQREGFRNYLHTSGRVQQERPEYSFTEYLSVLRIQQLYRGYVARKVFAKLILDSSLEVILDNCIVLLYSRAFFGQLPHFMLKFLGELESITYFAPKRSFSSVFHNLSGLFCGLVLKDFYVLTGLYDELSAIHNLHKYETIRLSLRMNNKKNFKAYCDVLRATAKHEAVQEYLHNFLNFDRLEISEFKVVSTAKDALILAKSSMELSKVESKKFLEVFNGNRSLVTRRAVISFVELSKGRVSYLLHKMNEFKSMHNIYTLFKLDSLFNLKKALEGPLFRCVSLMKLKKCYHYLSRIPLEWSDVSMFNKVSNYCGSLDKCHEDLQHSLVETLKIINFVSKCIKIQKCYRCWRNRFLFQQALCILRNSLLRLQCFFRASLARMKVAVLRNSDLYEWESVYDHEHNRNFYFNRRLRYSQWSRPTHMFKLMPQAIQETDQNGICSVCNIFDIFKGCIYKLCMFCCRERCVCAKIFHLEIENTEQVANIDKVSCCSCKAMAEELSCTLVKCDQCAIVYCSSCYEIYHARGHRRNHTCKVYDLIE